MRHANIHRETICLITHYVHTETYVDNCSTVNVTEDRQVGDRFSRDEAAGFQRRQQT